MPRFEQRFSGRPEHPPNWETTPRLANVQIAQPVLFLAGEKDVVLRGATAEQLTATMSRFLRDLRGVKLYPCSPTG